ncbi:MAG: hypothetical protein QXF12_06845 [Candidatus Aenigmatarchaeota archaeon]
MTHKTNKNKLITMKVEYMHELHENYGNSKYMSYLHEFIKENKHKLYFIHLYDFDVDDPKLLDELLFEIKNKYFSDDIREDIVYDICLHYLDYIKDDNTFGIFICKMPVVHKNPILVSSEIDSKNFFSLN